MTSTSSTFPGTRSYYDVLGVTPSASPAEIANAFRSLAKKHALSTDTKDQDYYRIILEANRVLSDSASRNAYDQNQQKKPSTTMLRLPMAVAAISESTAVVPYQEVDLASLLRMSNLSNYDLYRECENNKDLAVKVLENEELRKKLSNSRWMLSNLLETILPENKELAKHILNTKYATYLKGKTVYLLSQKYQIRPEELHSTVLVIYQAYQKLLAIKADEKVEASELSTIIKNAKADNEDYKIFVEKNPDFFRTVWKYARNVFDSFEWIIHITPLDKTLTEAIYCEYIEAVCPSSLTEDEKICETLLSKAGGRYIAKVQITTLVELQLKLKTKKFTRALAIFNQTMEKHDKNKVFNAYQILSRWAQGDLHAAPNEIAKLLEQLGDDNTRFAFIIWHKEVIPYLWNTLITRNQISKNTWSSLIDEYEAIAIEFCRSGINQPISWIRAANNFKSVALLVLASGRKDQFGGLELSRLVKLHGTEVLTVILQNNLGMRLQAYELLHSALQQKEAFAPEDKNPEKATQAKVHFLIILADHYFQQKRFAEANVTYDEAIKLNDKQALAKKAKLAETLKDEKTIAACANLYLHNPAFSDSTQAAICYEMLMHRGPYLEYRYALANHYLTSQDAKINDPKVPALIKQLREFRQPQLAIELLDIIQSHWRGKVVTKQLPRDVISQNIQVDPFLMMYDEWLGSIKELPLLKNCYKKLWLFYNEHGLETLAWKYCEKYLALKIAPGELSASDWKNIAFLYDRQVLATANGKYTLKNVSLMLSFILNASTDPAGFSEKHAKLLSEALVGDLLRSQCDGSVPKNPWGYLSLCTELSHTFPTLDDYLSTQVNAVLLHVLHLKNPSIPIARDSKKDSKAIKKEPENTEVTVIFNKLIQSRLGNKITARIFNRLLETNGHHYELFWKAIRVEKELRNNFSAYLLLLEYRRLSVLPDVMQVKSRIESVHFAENELRDFIAESDQQSEFVKFFMSNEALRSLLSEDDWAFIANEFKKRIKKIPSAIPIFRVKPQLTYEDTKALVWHYSSANFDTKETNSTEMVTYKVAPGTATTSVTAKVADVAVASAPALTNANPSTTSISVVDTPQTLYSGSAQPRDANVLPQANALRLLMP